MAIKIGRGEIEKLKKRATGAMSRLKNAREKAEETANQVVTAGTIGATAFLFGFANGRVADDEGKPGIEILGVPLDLLSAVGFHIMGFVVSDKYGGHFHNFGNGALASYTTILGVSVGTKMRAEANQAAANAAAPAASGRAIGPKRRQLSMEELQAIARQRA